MEFDDGMLQENQLNLHHDDIQVGLVKVMPDLRLWSDHEPAELRKEPHGQGGGKGLSP